MNLDQTALQFGLGPLWDLTTKLLVGSLRKFKIFIITVALLNGQLNQVCIARSRLPLELDKERNATQ